MGSAGTHAVFRKGATALITGAASGIGLALAQRCYSYHMNLVLLDKSDDGLQQALKQFPSIGSITTSGHSIDVSSIESWRNLVPQIRAQYPKGIDLLALNAGTAIKPNEGCWEDYEYFEKTFAINTLGYTNGIVAVLDMVKSGNDPRAIVLTGSKQGITNPPSDPAYNASKAAVRTIAEHLSFDMAKAAPNVSVHLLVPGWTYTGFHTAAFKDKPAGAWTSEQVIDFMIQSMADGKFYIMCPDNEVSEELDSKRIMWTTNDILEGRPPLSRWREEWAEKAKKAIYGE
ncbi:hypothetical protein PISL3812_09656 [Talaromyces islandicus]|uniref:Short chain dehydrogenase/reductase n=1 Tax=Talaromyces islandicus TaxID=28573 RepID=A0A0U1MAB4_TALIS|nr:hypothetical protein PISL3812_09656 [Talaromyces islandicus]